MKESLRIIMKGPHLHPSWLSSVTKVFPEHKFFITGPILTPFTQLHGIENNVTIIEKWEDLVKDPNWIKNYDLFLGYVDSDDPFTLEAYKIPKIWRAYSPIAAIDKFKALQGPIVFNSYTAQNLTREFLRLYFKTCPFEILDARVCYDYKDPKIFRGWHGTEKAALIVCSNFKERGTEVGYSIYEKILRTNLPNVSKIPITVLPIPGQNLALSDLVKEYQKHQVFLELTQGARVISGTIMEAMMTGMPIVTTPRGDFPILVRPRIEGFLSDDAERIAFYISLLCNSPHQFSEALGTNARFRAIELCGESPNRLAYEEAFLKALDPDWFLARKWEHE
jgi:glycosyltransferase involved in cell wall biosynthesis